MRNTKYLTMFFIVVLLLVGCSTAAAPVEEAAEEPVEAAAEEPAEEVAEEPDEEVSEGSAEGETVIPEYYQWEDNYEIDWYDTTQYAKEPPYTIGFSNCSTSNAWGVLFWETAKWEVAKHPEIEEFYTTDAGDNAAKQLSDIEDLIAKGIDALIVRPCTLDAGVPAIERAMDMGIPVLISNRGTAAESYISQQATSFIQMGRNQGQWLVDQMGGEGTIVSIEGVAGSGPQIERYEGAMEIISQYPDIEVVARAQTSWNRAEAKTVMEDYLLAFPEIDGVLSQAGMLSAGAVEAIEEAGIDPCTIPVSGDDYNGWMKWIDSNQCGGMVTTNPTWCSGASITAALMVLNGEPVPHMWYIKTNIYDASNIDEVVLPNLSDEFYTTILPDDWDFSQ